MKALDPAIPPIITSPQTAKTIHTTLYDLAAALNAETAPQEEGLVIAALVHILQTKRILCTGWLKGYRLTCDPTAYLA